MKIPRQWITVTVIISSLSLFFGCATTSKEAPERVSTLGITDISQGLPRDGLWRQSIALIDINGDGFLDIVAPAPRKAEGEENRPHIFLWNQEEGKWNEGAFSFPPSKGYDYGGVAVGDLNKDGYPDIVLAIHTSRIILLLSDKGNGFVESPFPSETLFPVKDTFHSRTVAVADLKGDGWPDIISVSEASFMGKAYKPRGILVGLNKGGKDWDVKILEGSEGIYSDSLAVGDLRGSGNKDIVIAPPSARKEDKKLVWFGDGKGGFTNYTADLIGDSQLVDRVRTGDVDGDGRDEVVFRISGIGANAKIALAVFKWTGERFADISTGLEAIEGPIAFDLADIDGDGKMELIVLSLKGIGIYKHFDKGWVERGFHPLPLEETAGAFDLRVGKNRNGSTLIAYNLGIVNPSLNRGIRAYILR